MAAARYGLDAFDDARVRDFLGRIATAGLAQVDISRLAGQALDALTAGGRHQALLDDVLAQVAGSGRRRGGAGAQITEAIAREIKALRFVGLDQVAAKLATRKIVAAVATHHRRDGRRARAPAAAALRRLHGRVHRAPARPTPSSSGAARTSAPSCMAHPALGDYLHGLWGELLAWLHDDLAASDSTSASALSR